jgi:gamma-glutamylcyclotransferase (GGCT)/AIG2-like uncharacterized protein YtfP
MICDRLFVYGTLRRGSNNYYAELLAKTASHLGEGAVSGRLYRVTHYPALVKAKADHERVKGDLFEGITAELWALLDDYEGDAYSREIVDVTMEDGRALQSYVYRYALFSESLEWIRSGDWNQPDRIES